MRVLLVEPPYERKYPPLGLMKISTYHKERGDTVRYIRSEASRFLSYKPELIYITSLYTWDFDIVVRTINSFKNSFPRAEIKVGGLLASLLPEKIEEATGVNPHVGLLDYVESCMPDYSLFPEFDSSLVFSTRGCIRSCEFCIVKEHEPVFFENTRWREMIDPKKKKIVFFDNNFLASSRAHFDDVIDGLKDIGKPVDFNQGLDCRLMDEYKAKRLGEIKLKPVRFAFDIMPQERFIRRAVALTRKHITDNYRQIIVYILYNFKDTPEEALYRAETVKELGATPFAMGYKPIDKIEKNHVSENWTRRQITDFGRYWNRPWLWTSLSYEEYLTHWPRPSQMLKVML